METITKRILDFFNSADDKYEIRYRIKDDPNYASAPASGYGITLTAAQNILTRRDSLPPPPPPKEPWEKFQRVGQIFNVAGVGPVTEHNIFYSFSDSLLSWTASDDGDQVATLKSVGIGTLVAGEKLEIYDGSVLVRSYRDGFGLLGHTETRGAPQGVFVHDNCAFVADGSRFTVIDVSDREAPRILNDGMSMAAAQSVFVSGNHAYLADGDQGLQIFDISDPANPKREKGVDTDGIARGVHVSGDYAYVADGSKGLQIVDISDPANATLDPARNYDKPGAQGVYVAGDYAFVAFGADGLQVLDISDVTKKPELVTDWQKEGDARAVTVHGAMAFLAAGSIGLQILDISDPSDLRRIGQFDLPQDLAEDVFVAGSHAYVAYGRSGFRTVDVSRPTSPAEVDVFEADDCDVRGVFVEGDYTYVVDSNRGLSIYRMLTTSRIGADAHFGGNVGIGTAEPQARLDIDGDIRTTDLQLVGANQGGDFIRVGDVQLAWGSSIFRNPSAANAAPSFNFPRAFAGYPNVQITQRDPDATGYRKNLALRSVEPNRFSVWSPGGSGTTYYFDWLAVGKWR